MGSSLWGWQVICWKLCQVRVGYVSFHFLPLSCGVAHFSCPSLTLLNSTLSRRLLILTDLHLNFQRRIVSSSTIVILKWASLAEREIPLYLRYWSQRWARDRRLMFYARLIRWFSGHCVSSWVVDKDAEGCRYRVLLSIMPNGLPYQLWPLNTTPITSFVIQHIGSRLMVCLDFSSIQYSRSLHILT